jgi:hypothetical protein
MNWKPLDEAPKDGWPVLLRYPAGTLARPASRTDDGDDVSPGCWFDGANWSGWSVGECSLLGRGVVEFTGRERPKVSPTGWSDIPGV